MSKINQEEYEVLKGLDDGYKCIMRNFANTLMISKDDPSNNKHHRRWNFALGDHKFQSIKPNCKPHNIAELIEEYENEEFGYYIMEAARDYEQFVKESEETEVKKDKQWLINKVRKACDYEDDNRLNIKSYKMVDLINQLDEPETLSKEWLVEHSYNVHLLGTPDVETVAVPRDALYGILVPEQKELETKIQELIEVYKREDGQYSNPENGWISGFIKDLKNLVEEEQKYEKILRVGEMFFRGGGYKDDVFVLELSDSRNAHVFVDQGEAINIQSSIGGQLEELEE